MSDPSEPLPRRRNDIVFRPRFTLMLFYLVGFFFLYGLLFALPELLAAASELPAGPEELTPEEQAQAEAIARQALGGGKIQLALMASIVTVGLAAWKSALPGLGERR